MHQQDQGKTPKIGRLVVACLLLVILAVIFLPAFTTRSKPRFESDLSNLQTIAIGIQTYAIDNDGTLPDHVSLLRDDIALGPWEFVSRQDPHGQNEPIITNTTPDEWYEYGSYIFYPTRDLELDDVSDPSKFVIGYCPPYNVGYEGKDHPTAFLDGSVEMLSKDELFDYIVAQQQALIQQPSE